MKKITLLIIALLAVTAVAFGQDQTINGNLYVGQNTTTYGEGKRLHLQGTAYSNDPVWIAKYTPQQEKTDLRINIGDERVSGDRLVVGTTQWNTGVFYELFVVTMNGNVGIGVTNPTSKLDVAGTIRAKEVKIEATGWSDFVFDKSYNLPKLSDVEKHINDRQHLPGIPSEKEVLEKGVNVVDMQAKLLQKIEELTLYVISQDKRIRTLEEENKKLKED